MRLHIHHATQYRYDPPAQRLALRLKLYALSNPAQRVARWSVTVDGKPVEPLLTDGFGEAEALSMPRQVAEEVEIVAEGVVETTDRAGVLGRLGHVRPKVFLRTTPVTRADAEIAALGRKAMEEAEDPLGRMHRLSELVTEALDYRHGATEPGTTAAQALAIGAGVCQDFAHVFIAAARSAGTPARYVVGYLYDEAEPLAETHAWAEAHVDGLGWVGFDPVHELCPTDAYVRLVSGFDAADAAPIRGTLIAGSEEALEVEVSVRPDGTQSQTQQQ